MLGVNKKSQVGVLNQELTSYILHFGHLSCDFAMSHSSFTVFKVPVDMLNFDES